MENPYRSPEFSPQNASDYAGNPFADHVPGGKASQVPLLAILMMVQGGLELLYAAFMLVMGVVMLISMRNIPPNPQGGPQGPLMVGAPVIINVVYLALGALLLTVGILKLAAGFRNYRYRGRTLGLVALFSGLAAVFSCYCFPTGLLLLIYGLIVYFDQQTAYAFELGARAKARADQGVLDRWR